MKFIKFALVCLSITLFNCSSIDSKSREHVLRYFYGYFEGKGGYLISSYSGDEREDYIRIKKSALKLDDSWTFHDEKLDLIELGSFEYIVRYECIFQDKKSNTMFLVEELFFTDTEIAYDPVPLKKIISKLDLKNDKFQQIAQQTIWENDFNLYFERRKRFDNIDTLSY